MSRAKTERAGLPSYRHNVPGQYGCLPFICGEAKTQSPGAGYGTTYRAPDGTECYEMRCKTRKRIAVFSAVWLIRLKPLFFFFQQPINLVHKF
jgi:hypothetical protein